MVPEHAESLRTRKAIWIDAGTRDEYFLDLGATAFRHALRDNGVPDEVVHFELFDGTHFAWSTGCRCHSPGSPSG